MADAASTARSMWTLFEPVHAVTYFAPEARSAYEQAGLRGFWRGYFAGRSAPLGAASAAVVTASFFNFAHGFVARAIPGVWELITPSGALQAREAGATEALRRLLKGREAEAAGELTSAGREAHAAVENATDWAAARPWTALGPQATTDLVNVLTPLARACAGALPYPSPIGVPAPGASARLAR